MKNHQLPNTQEQRRKQIKDLLLSAPELSNRIIARNLFCSHSTVAKVRAELIELGQIVQLDTPKDSWESHPYIKQNPQLLENLTERKIRAYKASGVLDKMEERSLKSPIYAQRLLNKAAKTARKSVSFKLTAGDIDLRCDDLTNGLNWIPDKEIDLIFSDLPYAKKYLPLFSSLSSIAARTLKDNGNLLVLCGNSHIPEAINRLSEHMKYHWQLCWLTPNGGSPPLTHLGVASYWKSTLWFRKPKVKYDGDIIYDVIKTAPPDKTTPKLHKWQQDLQATSTILERFTTPGMMVADFCLGSGTTAVAAVKAGCRFIGVDVDKESISITKDRISKILTSTENADK
jgi:site-specific DNA-methyltransferase (adenine-specific)